MRNCFVILLVVFSLNLLVSSGLAYELSVNDIARLDQPQSRYKVSPEMVNAVQDLFLPLELDAELPGGYVFEGIDIQRFYLRLNIVGSNSSFSVYLLPPVVDVEASVETTSFKVLLEGDISDRASAALLAAIIKNDDGSFWRPAPEIEEKQQQTTATQARKVHFTELLGDLFLLLLFFSLIGAAPSLRSIIGKRPLSWSASLLLVTAVAFGYRLVLLFMIEDSLSSTAWIPSGDFVYSSIGWYLNTVGRFSPLSLGTVVIVNMVFGVLTVIGLYLLLTLLVDGLFPALVAALVVATAPAHVALSASISAMVPLTCFLVWFAVFLVAFGLSGDLKTHLAAVMLGVFAMFARPEALVLVVPLMLWPFAKRPVQQWRKVVFWMPVCGLIGALVVRIATLSMAPDSSDSFLTWRVDWGSLHQNLGTWVFGLSRVSFALLLLVAMGFAAKPWRRDRFRFGLFVAWFLIAFGIYFHVNQTEAYVGGRLSLVMLPPLAYLAGEGARLLVNLKHRQRWWALAIVILWLLVTPVLHWNAMQRDYKATYQQNFLFEA